MSGPGLNMIALVGSILMFVGSIVVDVFVEERARESAGHWHYAYLIAPSLQIVFACIALGSVIVALRQKRHIVESVFGTILVIALSGGIIATGWSSYRRYSWVWATHVTSPLVGEKAHV